MIVHFDHRPHGAYTVRLCGAADGHQTRAQLLVTCHDCKRLLRAAQRQQEALRKPRAVKL